MNMKNKFNIVVLCLLAFVLTSCDFGNSKSDRLVGYWSLQNVYLNDSVPEAYVYPGDKAGNYYAFYEDNTMSVSYVKTATTIIESFQGTWEIGKSKTLVMNFLLMGKRYYRTYKILKLNSAEMRLQYIDDDGGVWTFYLYKS